MRALRRGWVAMVTVLGCATGAPDLRPGPEPPAGALDVAPRGGAGQVPPGIVDGETAHRLVASGVKVVDVRTAEEFATGHVAGALNIPHDQIARRHAEIGPPSTPVLLYCKSGRRSALAGEALRQQGFTAIYDLGTYDRWLAAEGRAPVR